MRAVLNFLLLGFALLAAAFRLGPVPRYRAHYFASKVIEVTADAGGDEGSKRKADVFKVLSSIIDPEAEASIVDAGFVRSVELKGEDLVVVLESKNPFSSMSSEIKKLCILQLSAQLDWLNGALSVSMEQKPVPLPPTPSAAAVPVNGLAKVKHIIAVSSCKGGVGKSTVSVNLAYTLKQAGAKVGILDADIYGPSLPTMTKPPSTDIFRSGEGQLLPLDYEGVKLMSMGFINKGASIMRGPMVNQILNQFVSLCNWGELDYLVVDMPPGTGDIQLTLAQIMNISAAVIVTTPQRLSFVDVVKGIDMFDTVNVPCVAVVENMADYYTYSFGPQFFEDLGAKISSSSSSSSVSSSSIAEMIRKEVEAQKKPRKVFGEGHTQRLRDMWGMETIISLPLLEQVSACGDSGRPYVVAYPVSDIATGMSKLAEGVVKEIARLGQEAKAGDANKLVFDEASNVINFQGQKLSPMSLRCDCRCAVCVEEFTGKKLLNTGTVPTSIKPLGMAPIGRYAMSVDWSDGHKSLYPFRQVKTLCGNDVAA